MSLRYSGGMLSVRIHRLHPSVPLPKYETAGAAGFDLSASEEVVVQPGRVALIPTGLVIEVPAGHFLGVFARSSTPLRRGLMVGNGVGVIDEDYCGPNDEIKVQVLNFTSDANARTALVLATAGYSSRCTVSGANAGTQTAMYSAPSGVE